MSQDGLWLCAIACLRDKAGGNLTAGTLLSSTPATTMATVMEVEEAEAEDKEPAAVAAVAGAHVDIDGGAVGNPDGACRGVGNAGGRSNSSDSVMAPQNGSRLGGWGQQTPPVTKTTGATASTVPAPATAAGAPLVVAKGAKVGSGGGSGQYLQGAAEGREEGKQEEQGKGSILAPWPSRARLRPYFSIAFTREYPGKGEEVAEKGGGPMASSSSGAAAERPASAGVAGRSDDARNEPPPFTPPPFMPSPRITLKRRLSGSWLNAVSGGRGSSGGLGGGGVGNSGGFWGRELRRRGSPRLGSSERAGGGGAMPRKEDRPPPLPPPPPPPGAPTASGVLASAASPPFPTTASPSSFAAHPQQPPARATLPSRASSDPSPASNPSSGGLRISLPLLLPPPPVIGLPAEELDQDQGEQRRRRERRQQPQGQVVHPQLPSQPVFFLQVPVAGAAAGVALGGLEGRGWDAQYLCTGAAGEGTAQEAPVTYGRRFVARSSSAGEAGHSRGGGRVHGSRQEGHPDDAVVIEGGSVGSQEANSMSWESSSGSSAPTSFGRTHRRVSPPVAPSPPGKFVPHLVLASLNLEDGRGAGGGGGGGEKVARVVRAEAMDMFTAKQVIYRVFRPAVCQSRKWLTSSIS